MNVQAQFCGLTILYVILYFYIYHKKVKLKTERAFFRFFVIALLCVSFDIISVFALARIDTMNPFLLEVICKIYVISVVASIHAALIYVCVDIYTEARVYKKLKLLFGIILLIGAVCVSLLPIKYHYEAVSGDVYTYGYSVLVGYIFGFVFLFILILQLIFKSQKMNRRRRNAMAVWIAIWSLAVVVQFLKNELLLMSFAGSLGIVIVYLLLENPEANLDKTTGAFNQTALVQYVNQHYLDEKKFAALEMVVERGIGNVAMELCEFLIAIKGAKVFRYSSNNIMLIFEKGEDVPAIKESIVERLERGLGKDNNTILKPYWYYVAHSEIVNSGKDFLNLIKYAHHNVLDKTSNDMTRIDSSMARDMYSSIKITQLLEEAIKNDKIEVFYQPIYSTAAGSFTTAEALVRLADEKGEIIQPGAFIDIAEHNGMILRLGEMVFERVCRFVTSEEFEELGLKYIEVNLSVTQCSHKNLAEDYVQIMDKYGVDPSRINLEITETASAGAKKTLLQNMSQLKAYGIEFSLDDFGTGQSNLNYIAEMPVGILKFDIGMTRAYFESKKARYVMNAAIGMARGMELSIVFEGIETEEQYIEAERMGIDYIQGFYFARPMPEREFCNFLKNTQSA